ncbi:MAG: CHAD domain-containing protein [Acetobacterium sp.]
MLGDTEKALIPKGKKINLKIKPNEKLPRAIEKIVINNINAIINAQNNLLAQMDDPENVHQLRVKIRQLRGLLSFFSPLFDKVDYHEKQRALSKSGLVFSEIREVDVILEEIEKMTNNSLVSLGDFPLLKNKLEQKRRVELERITAFSKNNELTAILLDLRVWLLEDPWINTELLDDSIKKYSEKRLARWSKRINKAMVEMEMSDKEAIHQVRIRSKKLRYVMEQLRAILDSDSKKSIKRFEKLQEDLGYFHDVYINKLFLEKLIGESNSAQLHYEAGLFVGWQINQGNLMMSKYQ